eukprot:CAMPEP_0179890290 /NCGR_PEP_ID=MMETSP0982-20121206/33041_1 /TAXON_ID=483367 /ORGANISM="non described non described, Strain CCMP 2436" /LENGTH=72 /DNA_ID=CAMNT_0021786539 /DNA_START=152 /DNA_END=367 /DNA_ORIENTATION=-
MRTNGEESFQPSPTLTQPSPSSKPFGGVDREKRDDIEAAQPEGHEVRSLGDGGADDPQACRAGAQVDHRDED